MHAVIEESAYTPTEAAAIGNSAQHGYLLQVVIFVCLCRAIHDKVRRYSGCYKPATAGIVSLIEKRSGGFETMAKREIQYDHYFTVGQQVKAGVRLSADLLRECNGEITAFSGNRARVEILGGTMPKALSSQKPGSRISLSGWSGWGFYCCEAILIEFVSPNEFDLRLEGDIEEIQRREYFLTFPARYGCNLPADDRLIERAGKEKGPAAEGRPSGDVCHGQRLPGLDRQQGRDTFPGAEPEWRRSENADVVLCHPGNPPPC
jgi:hypothetical protein